MWNFTIGTAFQVPSIFWFLVFVFFQYQRPKLTAKMRPTTAATTEIAMGSSDFFFGMHESDLHKSGFPSRLAQSK